MDRSPICATVIEAGKQLGLEYREDVNDLPPGAGDSIGWCQQTRGGRRRASTARTYLRPALKRPNLQLVTKALVHRVLFEGKRATGVEFSRGGARRAGRRGARGDPVGRRGRLAAHPATVRGRRSRASRPRSACRSCTNCAASAATCRTTTSRASPIRSSASATANERSRGLPLAGEVMRWLVTGKGMLSYSPSLVAASVKVLEESATPDVQITFAPGSFKDGQIGELEAEPGLTAGAWQMRPLSRGYVEAKSNRPGDMPAINPRYLSEESDRRAIVGGLRFVRADVRTRRR